MQDTEVVAFRMTLNDGMAEEYRRRHDAIWPGLKAELLARGVIDYRIFHDPRSNHLFAVMTRRRGHGLDALRHTEVMQAWWRMMADIMTTRPDASPEEVALEPVFSLTGGGPG